MLPFCNQLDKLQIDEAIKCIDGEIVELQSQIDAIINRVAIDPENSESKKQELDLINAKVDKLMTERLFSNAQPFAACGFWDFRRMNSLLIELHSLH